MLYIEIKTQVAVLFSPQTQKHINKINIKHKNKHNNHKMIKIAFIENDISK